METVNHRENLEELAERVNLWTQVFFKGTAAGDLYGVEDHDLHGSALVFCRLDSDPAPYWECGSGPGSMRMAKMTQKIEKS